MRFSIVAAALLSVAASASAQITTDDVRGQKFQCGKITKISLKKFSFEKKTVAFVVEDNEGKELCRQTVYPNMDEVEMKMPQYTVTKPAKLFFKDVKTNAEVASAQQIVIDCPERNSVGGGRNRVGDNTLSDADSQGEDGDNDGDDGVTDN